MKFWVLYSYDDPDNASVLESFNENDEDMPTAEYIRKMYSGGVLYEYDLVGESLQNERKVEPK